MPDPADALREQLKRMKRVIEAGKAEAKKEEATAPLEVPVEAGSQDRRSSEGAQ